MVRPMERSALPVLSASVPGGKGKPLDDSASAPKQVAGKRFKDKSRTGPFPAARPGQSANALPGVIRIIGGQWRRRKLPVAQGPGVPAGLRPTPDRVRETLFNWLGQDLGGWRCVDVCAGTGALGFEAASRGAARVRMIEQHPVLLKQLHGICKQLDAQAVQIVAGDGMRFLRDMANREPGSVDVIFFDPPFSGFSGETYDDALRRASVLLVPGGNFYLESGREWRADELAAKGWERRRYLRAGAAHAHLLRVLPKEEISL